MKRFIAYKRIKKLKYKKIIIYSLVICLLFIFINILFKRINIENFLNIVKKNSFGNVTTNNLFNNYKTFFYKNSFGLNFSLDESVINENNNLEDLSVSMPIIYLYNTFQTDKYASNYHNSYNINNVITQASLILQEYLKDNGINSIVELNSVAKVLKEENIDYTLSYRGSKIEKAFKENPSLKYFFDIQLSDNKYDETTLINEDKKYAKILIVVGTENTNFEKNLEFANLLNNKLNENLEGIANISKRGGAGYHGYYNQEFSEKALLIQVGGKDNTIDEVNRTLKFLAKVLASYVKEEKDG